MKKNEYYPLYDEKISKDLMHHQNKCIGTIIVYTKTFLKILKVIRF